VLRLVYTFIQPHATRTRETLVGDVNLIYTLGSNHNEDMGCRCFPIISIRIIYWYFAVCLICGIEGSIFKE
jgi:hypothetical protein